MIKDILKCYDTKLQPIEIIINRLLLVRMAVNVLLEPSWAGKKAIVEKSN